MPRRDLVKGHEFSKNRYLLLTDEESESVKAENSSVMSIDKFVETRSIDPIYYASSCCAGWRCRARCLCGALRNPAVKIGRAHV